MPWRPLPRIAFAICTYPFPPSSSADLPLQIGDELYIIEQGGKYGGWYRGYLVAPPSLLAGLTSNRGQALEARVFSGIFPRDCVEIRELLGEVTQYGQNEEESRKSAQDRRAQARTRAPTYSDSTSRHSSEWPGPLKNIRAVHDGKRFSAPASTSSSKIFGSRSLEMIQHTAKQSKDVPISALLSRDTFEWPKFSAAGSRVVWEPGGRRPPAPVPMLKIGDESVMAKQEPLVDEIASCLREWHSTNLHELLLNRQYSFIEDMSDLVARLDSARRQFLHKILTKKELENLRESAVWDLVSGNKNLSGEVIVRSTSKKGRILTCDDSAVEISRLQSIMSLLYKRPSVHAESKSLHHLLADFRTSEINVDKSITFAICLYKKSPSGNPTVISETFAIDTPDTDTATMAPVDEKTKTLFTDLNIGDAGDVLSEHSMIYLVVKVMTIEIVKDISRQSQEPLSGRDGTPVLVSGGPNASVKIVNLKTPRRSLMWGQTRRKDSENKSKSSMERPSTATSIFSRIDPRPGSAQMKTPLVKDHKPICRTTGIGVIEISNLLMSQADVERRIAIWSPASAEELTNQADNWDNLIKDILPSLSGKYSRSSPLESVGVRLRSFSSPDSEALVQCTPTMLHDIQITQRIGFAGAPPRPRSDIYLTLFGPSLPWNVFLSHPISGNVPLPDEVGMANLQLTLEVRNATGQRIDSCIYPSSNSAGHTAWRTTAIERGESWNQTIRLAISAEDVPGCHIIMSIADGSSFPFALCWMPLWTQEAFARDGDHSLILYKYDEHTSSIIGGKGAYLSLPWSTKTKDESITGPVAALHILTYLCSTEYSQDPNLLGLLRWREQRSREIAAILERFSFVPEIEIVKLLSEVFDALFETLVEYAGSDDIEDLVFNAVVTVLGIMYDKRFNLQPLVDEYIKIRFKYPFAFPCLARSYIRLLSDSTNSGNARKLRATFKVGKHVLSFIITARQQLIVKEVGIGIKSHRPTFAKDLQGIFTAVDNLMRNPAPLLVGTKTFAIQNFDTWLLELRDVMNSNEILEIAMQFVDSCSEAYGKLILYKLILINNISSLNLFSGPEAQSTWSVNTVRWLTPHWGQSSPSQQWRDQIRLCCSVVATQLNNLSQQNAGWTRKLIDSYNHLRSYPRSSGEPFSMLFQTTYPFVTMQTASSAEYDEGLIEIAAVLAATCSLSSTINPDLPQDELSELLADLLHVHESIIDCNAFPPSWLSVHIFHHKAILKTLELISDFLSQFFLPHPDNAAQFNTELWRTFFSTLLKVVGSNALTLETFPEQKRRAVWKIGGDLRQLGAELLQRTWDAIGWETNERERSRHGLGRMGGYQVQYVPGLVGPILQLCLSVHEGLRSVAIMVLQTMIVSEWALSQDLGVIQAEIIGCLDQLFKTKNLNDVILQKSFIGELVHRFQPMSEHEDDPLLRAVVEAMIGTIDELLDLLVAVHSPIVASEASQIMDTLRLMHFLKDIQKEDIYVAYVHKLAHIQADAKNPTEAGLALKMHADLHDWSTSGLLPALKDPYFPTQTPFERKEQIYFQMIRHFEDGAAWHDALKAYGELASQYEYSIFDFSKLARTHRAMATIFEKVSKGGRHHARYFRIVYRGLGFPPSLRDKQFIFEGSSMDRLTTFTDKLQQQYPSAQIINNGAIDDFEGQYLSIYPVSAYKDLLHPVNRRAKAKQSVKEYFMLARPRQFTTTSRRQDSNTGVKDQVLEKIVFTTADAFPTILRRSEIISTDTVRLSPVRIGLERTVRKTQELSALQNRNSDGGDAGHQALAAGLRILVDPQSNGSVAGYWSLLPPGYGSNEKKLDYSEAEVTLDPQEEALKVALMDHVLLIRRCLAMFTRSADLLTKAELTKNLESTFASAITVIDATSHLLPEPETKPWVWKMSDARRVFPRSVRPGDRRDEDDTEAGATEYATVSFDLADSTAPAAKDYYLDGAPNQATWASPRSSNLHETRPADTDKSVAIEQANNGQRPVIEKQESLQSLQSRAVGSVTRRLSSLVVGKKGSKTSVRNLAVDTLTE